MERKGSAECMDRHKQVSRLVWQMIFISEVIEIGLTFTDTVSPFLSDRRLDVQHKDVLSISAGALAHSWGHWEHECRKLAVQSAHGVRYKGRHSVLSEVSHSQSALRMVNADPNRHYWGTGRVTGLLGRPEVVGRTALVFAGDVVYALDVDHELDQSSAEKAKGFVVGLEAYARVFFATLDSYLSPVLKAWGTQKCNRLLLIDWESRNLPNFLVRRLHRSSNSSNDEWPEVPPKSRILSIRFSLLFTNLM